MGGLPKKPAEASVAGNLDSRVRLESSSHHTGPHEPLKAYGPTLPSSKRVGWQLAHTCVLQGSPGCSVEGRLWGDL